MRGRYELRSQQGLTYATCDSFERATFVAGALADARGEAFEVVDSQAAHGAPFSWVVSVRGSDTTRMVVVSSRAA